MAEKVEDLSLPSSVVVRILKDAIPETVNVSKEARAVFAKAASVFVLYATSCANAIAMKAHRKTLTASDVMQAMTDMQFEEFVDPMQKSLDAYHSEKGKKDVTASLKPKKRKNIEVLQTTNGSGGVDAKAIVNGANNFGAAEDVESTGT